MSDDKKQPRLGHEAIRRGLWAALLAWLLPGAGHYALGARRRAIAFFSVVAFTVGLGLACDGNLAVVDSQRAPVLSALQVVGNLSLGPVEPLMRTVLYGMPVYREASGRPRVGPRSRAALKLRTQRSFREASMYGSAYLMAAGLMNMLLILDAWDLGIRRRS